MNKIERLQEKWDNLDMEKDHIIEQMHSIKEEMKELNKTQTPKGCGIHWTDEGTTVFCGMDYGKLWLCKKCREAHKGVKE